MLVEIQFELALQRQMIRELRKRGDEFMKKLLKRGDETE